VKASARVTAKATANMMVVAKKKVLANMMAPARKNAAIRSDS